MYLKYEIWNEIIYSIKKHIVWIWLKYVGAEFDNWISFNYILKIIIIFVLSILK